MKSPDDYTFDSVNDFVAGVDTSHEELQCLCLGLATEMERNKKRIPINTLAVGMIIGAVITLLALTLSAQ